MLAVRSCTVVLKCPLQEAQLEMQMCPAAGPQGPLLRWNAVLSGEEAVGSHAQCRKGWAFWLSAFAVMDSGMSGTRGNVSSRKDNLVHILQRNTKQGTDN